MPVGQPTYFEGDITKIDAAPAFGFFEVITPSEEQLNIPFLQTKVKIDKEVKTISPIGT